MEAEVAKIDIDNFDFNTHFGGGQENIKPNTYFEWKVVSAKLNKDKKGRPNLSLACSPVKSDGTAISRRVYLNLYHLEAWLDHPKFEKTMKPMTFRNWANFLAGIGQGEEFLLPTYNKAEKQVELQGTVLSREEERARVYTVNKTVAELWNALWGGAEDPTELFVGCTFYGRTEASEGANGKSYININVGSISATEPEDAVVEYEEFTE